MHGLPCPPVLRPPRVHPAPACGVLALPWSLLPDHATPLTLCLADCVVDAAVSLECVVLCPEQACRHQRPFPSGDSWALKLAGGVRYSQGPSTRVGSVGPGRLRAPRRAGPDLAQLPSTPLVRMTGSAELALRVRLGLCCWPTCQGRCAGSRSGCPRAPPCQALSSAPREHEGHCTHRDLGGLSLLLEPDPKPSPGRLIHRRQRRQLGHDIQKNLPQDLSSVRPSDLLTFFCCFVFSFNGS